MLAPSMFKALRTRVSRAVSMCRERIQAWLKMVRIWLTKTRPHAIPPEVVKENIRKYYYEFVGECYLHGMMDGEAIKFQNDNEVKAETFEIR